MIAVMGSLMAATMPANARTWTNSLGQTGRRRCSHGLSELKRTDSRVTYTPVYAIYATQASSFQRPLIEGLLLIYRIIHYDLVNQGNSLDLNVWFVFQQKARLLVSRGMDNTLHQ